MELSCLDSVSRRVIWQYGTYDRTGSAAGHLHTPDDAYPLSNGDVVVVFITNKPFRIDYAHQPGVQPAEK